MTNTERQAVKLMADEICRAIKKMNDENNRSVGKQSSSGASSQSFSGIISVSQISNLTPYISGLIGGAQSNAEIDPNAQLIFSAISGIADLRVENATITTAQIEDLYASYGEFLHLVADKAEIGELDVEQIRADIAEMGIANIGSANIGFAQIKDLVSNTAIIREGLGGKLYIDRLAVTDAQILSLTTGNLIVQSTDGKLYSVYIDEDGEIHTELRVMSGDDIAEGTIEGSNIANNTITGALITENAITARELNVSKIFADDALIGAIKAGNIDTATLFADDAFISKLTTAIIQSPSIGENIDISKNSSIALTNERLLLMVESESNESKIILTDKMIQAIGDKFKIIADDIDLQGNESIQLIAGRKNTTYYREDAPTEFNSGDTWIHPATRKIHLARGMTGKNAPELMVDDRFDLCYRFGEDADEYDLAIDDQGNLLANDSNAAIGDDGSFEAKTVWMEIAPSELHTSGIDIEQDKIDIYSSGNINILSGGSLNIDAGGDMNIGSGGSLNIDAGGDMNIGSGGSLNIDAGGELNVDSGAAHFRTSEYTLAVLADDGTEDTVMDFDADSKTLHVTELNAGNMRPFIAGTIEVKSESVGGLDGLKGMLESARYEHLVYIQKDDDASSEPVQIIGCDSLQVEILATIPTRVPPLVFEHAIGNVYMENLVWNSTGQTALTADSGSFVLRDCKATAKTGVNASRHARVVWIGANDTATDGGTCTTAFEATEGGEIRAFGLIPSGATVQTLAGVVTVTDSSVGSGGEVETKEQTITLTGTLGYYGTNNGWNNGMMYQGYSNGKGRIYGCMRFTLPDDMADIQIKAATLTLHRVSGAGSGSNINVSVYGSKADYGSKSPSLDHFYASREKAAATGASCTLDVTQAAQDLVNGDIRQLVLWTNESAASSGAVYSRHYGKFDSAKLKITY